MEKIVRLRMLYGLSEASAKVLFLLLARDFVTDGMICDEHKILKEVKQAMYRLRRQMKEHGVEIDSARQLGYWLDAKNKQRVWSDLRGENTAADSLAEELKRFEETGEFLNGTKTT